MFLTVILKNVNSLPPSVKMKTKNNEGGGYNHRFFFDEMTEEKGIKLTDGLLNAIEACFESMGNFKEIFEKHTLSLFVSEHVRLFFDSKGLKIITQQ